MENTSPKDPPAQEEKDSQTPPEEEQDESKRKREEGQDAPEGVEATEESEAKKQKTEDATPAAAEVGNDSSAPPPVLASTEGTDSFRDADVLSGRGGGTNVHPGNRNFRDLINLHRRAYLKARKNDKPAISRAIVRSIRENNGRFLKKDEKSGLWFEIGDDAAREKTSQALRQRAPEMRKLLFDTEREEARVVAEEQIRQQRMIMGMGPGGAPNLPPGMNPAAMFPNPALLAMANKNGMTLPNVPQGQDPYSTMFSAALLQNNMNRFAPNGA